MMKQNAGSALIFTMIFMGLMVLAALVSVQFSGLEQKMSASYRSSQSAFIAAESTLLEGERCVKEQAACNTVSNFNSSCSGGLCFSGTNSTNIVSCRAGIAQPWEDVNLWLDNSRTLEATTLPAGTSGRYIIEFLCYVPNVQFGVTPNPNNPSDWAGLYRITALASVDNTSSRAMVQSTYKN